MNILIAGASGFIGTQLIDSLSQQHNITALGRDIAKLKKSFPDSVNKLTWENLSTHDSKSYDIVINLSGSNIGAKKWNPLIKKELIESRTKSNSLLIEWLIRQNAKPRFFCANAVGIYGALDESNEALDEYYKLPPQPGNDFLQEIGLAWEYSIKPAIDNNIPVTTLRFGVVLKKNEGILKKLELPFRLGVGSILGSGKQAFSWIHYKDLVNAIEFIIKWQDLTGAVNITSPYPITQHEFAIKLATGLHRPLFFRIPAWFIKTIFGEMVDYLLLKGQKVLPGRLIQHGFKFSYPTIETALIQEYQKN